MDQIFVALWIEVKYFFLKKIMFLEWLLKFFEFSVLVLLINRKFTKSIFRTWSSLELRFPLWLYFVIQKHQKAPTDVNLWFSLWLDNSKRTAQFIAHVLKFRNKITQRTPKWDFHMHNKCTSVQREQYVIGIDHLPNNKTHTHTRVPFPSSLFHIVHSNINSLFFFFFLFFLYKFVQCTFVCNI